MLSQNHTWFLLIRPGPSLKKRLGFTTTRRGLGDPQVTLAVSMVDPSGKP